MFQIDKFLYLRPEKSELTEEPVYDLRDHPDFKYRPGSVVIRVANFPESTENEESKKSDANCFGGQVLDILTTGEISVWWVDGSVSLTWPQDLYKVSRGRPPKEDICLMVSNKWRH